MNRDGFMGVCGCGCVIKGFILRFLNGPPQGKIKRANKGERAQMASVAEKPNKVKGILGQIRKLMENDLAEKGRHMPELPKRRTIVDKCKQTILPYSCSRKTQSK